jgi:large subunit ribosomal protein L10
MPTARKKEAVKELQHLFTDSQVLIFTDYRGLKVSDITQLRRQLREKGVEYQVSKNTLTTLAADRAGIDQLGNLLDGPTAIAFVNDDIQGAAKVLSDFARTSRILQIRGGLMGKAILTADQVNELTRLLTREQYIAKALGSMQSPISSMVNVLSGTIRSFMNVMQARVDQLKEQGDTSGDAATAEPAAEAQALEGPVLGGSSASPNSGPIQAQAAEETASEASTEAPTPEPGAPEASGGEEAASEEAGPEVDAGEPA